MVCLDHGRDLVGFTDVAGDAEGASAHGLDVLGGLGDILPGAGGDDDVGALFGKGDGDGLADAGASAGDDGDTVGEVEAGHGRLLGGDALLYRAARRPDSGARDRFDIRIMFF